MWLVGTVIVDIVVAVLWRLCIRLRQVGRRVLRRPGGFFFERLIFVL